MYTDFTIKNFRIFDEEGTIVPLRPVTILTGCNNTGKSSIVKALCLLKDFCQQIETDYNDGKTLHLDRYKMDFQKSPNNIMGGFDLVRHHSSSTNNDNKHIIFELVVESSWLLQDVILHLEFGSLEWDAMNNGYLQKYAIKTLDGKVIYSADRKGGCSLDLSIVKKELLHFLYGQYAFAKWQNEISYREATSSFPHEDDDKECKLFSESVQNIANNLSPTALVMMLEWQVSNCHKSWVDGVIGPANPILKNVEESSFITKSPSLGVFCYFPCLDVLKDLKKEDVILDINNRLEAQKQPVSSLDRKIINLFFKSFEDSDAQSLHEFVSMHENSRFFIHEDMPAIVSKDFAFPHLGLYMDINSAFFDDSDLPKSANWAVIVYAMDLINKIITGSTHSFISFDEINYTWTYYNEYSVNDFLKNIIEDIFVHLIPGSLSYSPTNIIQPKRLYSLEDNNDFSRTLKRYYETKGLYENNSVPKFGNRYQPCAFINKWMKNLEIAEHIEIKSHAEGFGVTIHLFEDETDTVGMHLADKGFGVLQLFAVLLKIETAILEAKTNEELYQYNYQGLNREFIKYLRGHNQLYPATVALEEPECHLHPSLQSKFAEMIVDANKQYGIHFIIESHSEYFIRKIQLAVSQEEIQSNDIALLYVNPKKRAAYLPVISNIGLDSDGTLKNEFGPGFFDEGLRLSRELYKSKGATNEE